MNVKQKLMGLAVPGLATVQAASAHTGPGPGYGMMGDCLQAGWCDGAAHMMGYGWMGFGAFGFLFGIAVWVLAIIGVLHLLQQYRAGNTDK